MPPPRSSKSTFATTTLLALSSFLSGRAHGFLEERRNLGYGIVSQEEADMINEDNKLHFEELAYVNRLGFGLWMADERKVEEIGKVWIPKSYQKVASDGQVEQQDLWADDEDAIVKYIESLTLEEPERALRLSWVEGIPWQLQMVIPANVVTNNDLDFWAKCFESEDALMDFSDDVNDWEAWNITGDRGEYSE
ncbi:hypothetical protein MBM_06106 [Drepanopeziza brunnea f. sp. 'multigermtubi' MB_m1]|uniref:Uncharacterized protein n=1 Tax=Marssonina brunnea f. sp. multigermtubi (strain MB_m1) TaxID=1072389 RepID=K1X453_MARBU|nr:uncharacterized protein MBM_06106 [Drepanopeziza brunnea f. sp. 'multigermtubi' MB_m1]EKD15478.1 hypothetical protein MBM_06106 [Drepanopeziza brunnea f. sp. 'multigermtubi' MB_m1]